MQKVELFKPEDFDQDYGHSGRCYIEFAAKRANEKLQHHIESLPKVYFKYLGGGPFNIGPELNKEDDTHAACLFNIEEIKKEIPKVSDKHDYEKRLNEKARLKNEEFVRKTGELIIEEIIKHFKKEGTL